MCQVLVFKNIFSIVLAGTEMKLPSWTLPGSSFMPFFKLDLPFFALIGNLPYHHDLPKLIDSRLTMILAMSLRNLRYRLCGLIDFYMSNLLTSHLSFSAVGNTAFLH